MKKMSHESNSKNRSHEEIRPDISIESGYENVIPEEFKTDPIGYFENSGHSLKPWKVKDKVKEFIWVNEDGKEVPVVVKIISEKGEIADSGDDFYEYEVIRLLNELGLPSAKPMCKVKLPLESMFVTERIPGITYSEVENLFADLRARGYSDLDIEGLREQAQKKIKELQALFEQAGIFKSNWKAKDMVFEVDVDTMTVLRVTPTDFERTKVDKQKLEQFKKAEDSMFEYYDEKRL